MRPLTLKLQAFGPYADVETIDFNQLENRKMFVISGKTGSGKTSIFDGISFAIYGEASGEDRAGSELRSHFAKEHVMTEVSLIFSLKNETYYIKRSPQQLRKKTRGQGYTTVNAKAELYKLDEHGSWELLTANVRDTNEKIREIMQLDANQFRQILMIPQGEFRKLLTSDSKEKELILQRLFHTELYKKVENYLRDQANELKATVETEQTFRDQMLIGLYTNGNEQLEAALNEQILNDRTILQIVEDVLKEMEDHVKLLQEKMNKQQTKRDQAKKQFDEATNLLQEIAQRDELKKKKEQLEKEKEMIVQLKEDLNKAERANKLQHQETLCVRLKQQLDEIKNNRDEYERNYKQANEQLVQFEQVLQKEESREPERESVQAKLIQLVSVKDDVYSYTARIAEQAQLKKKLQQTEKIIASTKESVLIWSEKIEEKQADLKKLNELQFQMVEVEREASRLVDVLNKLQQLQEAVEREKTLTERLAIEKEQLEQAEVIVKTKKKKLNELEDMWRKGHATILAKSLEEGCPCPVCGSKEHPNKAQSSDSLPDEEQIEKAKTALQRAEQVLLNADRKCSKTMVEAEHCKESLASHLKELKQLLPSFSLSKLEAVYNELKNKYQEQITLLKQNETHISHIPEIEEQLNQFEKKKNETNESLDSMEQKEKELSKKLIEITVTIETLNRNLPDGMTSKADYDRQVANLQKKSEEMKKALTFARDQFAQAKEKVASLQGTLANMAQSLIGAEETLKKERNIFLTKLQEEQFANYRDYADAKRDEQTIAQMEEKIKAFGEEYRSVKDRLQDYEKRLANKTTPNMEELESAWKEQERQLVELNERYANVTINIRKNKEIVTKVNDINEKIKVAEQQYELLGHLSDITRGQNTYKLTFERFVLAAFLEDILVAANIRLLRMTSGRYQLLRKTDRSKGNVQSGLEILVFDHYTGQERHVKTLSGGESFKAALSLALGLADVVQEYAGGVSLETMFIDEGFGTLDPESLDHAIEALMDIQSSGRLVGLISHVPELKERIDARLEVVAGQNGSKTKFVFLS